MSLNDKPKDAFIYLHRATELHFKIHSWDKSLKATGYADKSISYKDWAKIQPTRMALNCVGKILWQQRSFIVSWAQDDIVG